MDAEIKMRKRILFLADSLGNGGAERQLTLLVKYLPPDYECLVRSLANGPFVDVLRNNGIQVEVRQRRWRFDIIPIINLWQKVSSWHPALVHSYGWLSSAAIAPFCRIKGIPWIDGSIRSAILHTEKIKRIRADRTLALADRVIANSQAGLKTWNISNAKGRVIYNGFDPQRLPLTARVEPKRTSFTVVMAARMVPYKDFEMFIQAARNITTTDGKNAWFFWALGDGPDRSTLIEGAADLIKKDVIDFPNAGLEVLPYVRQADAGLLLTIPAGHEEGCSNSIIEYMACSLPVICTDCGGNRELVIDGKTGFIVPPNDVNALTEKLLWLREHQQEASEMGMAGRQRFLENFTVEKLVENTVAVYKELLMQ